MAACPWPTGARPRHTQAVRPLSRRGGRWFRLSILKAPFIGKLKQGLRHMPSVSCDPSAVWFSLIRLPYETSCEKPSLPSLWLTPLPVSGSWINFALRWTRRFRGIRVKCCSPCLAGHSASEYCYGNAALWATKKKLEPSDLVSSAMENGSDMQPPRTPRMSNTIHTEPDVVLRKAPCGRTCAQAA